MKTNQTSESALLHLPVLRAANEDAVGSSVNPVDAAAASQGWDPHEVWRTRILPYQRELRIRQHILDL